MWCLIQSGTLKSELPCSLFTITLVHINEIDDFDQWLLQEALLVLKVIYFFANFESPFIFFTHFKPHSLKDVDLLLKIKQLILQTSQY